MPYLKRRLIPRNRNRVQWRAEQARVQVARFLGKGWHSVSHELSAL
jgi:hypothetical protein